MEPFYKNILLMLQDFTELDEKRHFVTDKELIWKRKQILETNEPFLGWKKYRTGCLEAILLNSINCLEKLKWQKCPNPVLLFSCVNQHVLLFWHSHWWTSSVWLEPAESEYFEYWTGSTVSEKVRTSSAAEAILPCQGEPVWEQSYQILLG